MSKTVTLTEREPSDQAGIRADLSDHGAVVVKDLFSQEFITPIYDALTLSLEAEPWCNTADEGYGAKFFGRNTKRLHGALRYSPAIERCVMDPLPQQTAASWLGHKPQFSTAEVMAIGPGEVAQDLHTDEGSWRHARLDGELLFSMTVAITDFTAENGATVVAPGSHRWPSHYEPKSEDFTCAAMTAGSALFYTGSLLHGGGGNTTNETRIGLYFGYIPFWLQPLENPVTTHTTEFLDTLNEETQRFLGYHPHGFNAVLG